MATVKAEELKELGNTAIRNGNALEAMIHYTHAIKFDPKNHLLYSNRSLAFLKSQQYYFALEDAQQTIKLQPNWPKGFFRKGEVEFEVGKYADALMSYKRALILDPSDVKVKDAVNKANQEIAKEKKTEARQPLLFGGIGVLMGVLLILADLYIANQPSLSNIMLQVLIIVVFGALGMGIAKIYRFMVKSQRASLLDQPVDLLDEMNSSESSSPSAPSESHDDKTSHEPSHRKGKAAAYQRFRKGKS